MRLGNITSSEIVALTSNGKAKDSVGKPFYTYIQKKKWERNLGRPLESDNYSRPLSWGKCCEIYFFQHKGLLEYTPLMDEPIRHPELDYWLGSPDAINNSINAVSELKCPQTMDSFCGLVEPLMNGISGLAAINYIRDKHQDGEKYYWQLVSNSILTGKELCELIIFCPLQTELNEIREVAQNMDGPNLAKYYWIANSSDYELPYLPEHSKYQSINCIIFTPPKSDIDFLTERVKMAGSMLG